MTSEESAFIQGARWWEYRQNDQPMDESSQQICADVAKALKDFGLLGAIQYQTKERDS